MLKVDAFLTPTVVPLSRQWEKGGSRHCFCLLGWYRSLQLLHGPLVRLFGVV